MKTIWKFKVDNEIRIPAGAKFLAVQEQHGEPQMWFLVDDDPSIRIETRKFNVHGTGHSVGKNETYLGTFQVNGGVFVFHVFEVDKPRVQVLA